MESLAAGARKGGRRGKGMERGRKKKGGGGGRKREGKGREKKRTKGHVVRHQQRLAKSEVAVTGATAAIYHFKQGIGGIAGGWEGESQRALRMQTIGSAVAVFVIAGWHWCWGGRGAAFQVSDGGGKGKRLGNLNNVFIVLAGIACGQGAMKIHTQGPRKGGEGGRRRRTGRAQG